MPADGPLLVAEEDPDLRDLFSIGLLASGYSVAPVSREEPLQRIQEQKPSLLLLDLDEPAVDARKLAQTLRQRGIDVPVLVLSGADQADAAAREIGNAEVLKKPFGRDDLLHKVRQLRAA